MRVDQPEHQIRCRRHSPPRVPVNQKRGNRPSRRSRQSMTSPPGSCEDEAAPAGSASRPSNLMASRAAARRLAAPRWSALLRSAPSAGATTASQEHVATNNNTRTTRKRRPPVLTMSTLRHSDTHDTAVSDPACCRLSRRASSEGLCPGRPPAASRGPRGGHSVVRELAHARQR